MTSDPKNFRSEEIQEIDGEASGLMKEGISLLEDQRQESVAAALACFDQALELRQRLPFETSAMLRYGLAACWLNRADALMRLGKLEQVTAALQSYDEAIALLRVLPLQEDSLFPKRLAIAHQNRALTLMVLGVDHSAEAIEGFSKAIAILEHEDASRIPDRLYLLGAAWVNLAGARLCEAKPGSEQLALEEVGRAIALVCDLEISDADVAEVGIKARHLLCQIIARELSDAGTGGGAIPGVVHEASDAVDAGLDLARRWEQKGVTRFRSVAQDLFQFGLRLYGRYQPRFLSEFVSEHIDPSRSSSEYVESAEMRVAVQEAREVLTRGNG